MAVTGTETNEELCTAALRKIGVVATDLDATTAELEVARAGLSRMLKSWQNKEIEVFVTDEQSVTATTSAAHSLSPARPLSLRTVRLKQASGIEIPMVSMTREEYDSLPDKTTTGTPTQYYYDRQKDTGTLYVWPLFSSVTTQTFEVTYIREIEDVALDDVADVPAEWYEAVVYNLADRLSDDFSRDKPRVTARAQALFAEALAFDREGSVYFAGPHAT